MVEEMERDLIEMDGWNGRMAERAAEAESGSWSDRLTDDRPPHVCPQTASEQRAKMKR